MQIFREKQRGDEMTNMRDCLKSFARREEGGVVVGGTAAMAAEMSKSEVLNC